MSNTVLLNPKALTCIEAFPSARRADIYAAVDIYRRGAALYALAGPITSKLRSMQGGELHTIEANQAHSPSSDLSVPLLSEHQIPTTPIAIIGMACRLPGGIDSPDLLWEALLRGDDLITEIPPDRWDADEYYDPEPGVPGRSVSRWGAFVDDVGGFDSDFFGINEREATAIDPQHRLLLETSWEAMEHAGLTPASIANSLTGVFVGLTHGDYQLLAADAQSVEGP
jgi:polyketide synthase 5